MVAFMTHFNRRTAATSQKNGHFWFSLCISIPYRSSLWMECRNYYHFDKHTRSSRSSIIVHSWTPRLSCKFQWDSLHLLRNINKNFSFLLLTSFRPDSGKFTEKDFARDPSSTSSNAKLWRDRPWWTNQPGNAQGRLSELISQQKIQFYD